MLTTAPSNICPDCGRPIPPASPEGLCAHCLALNAAGALFSQPATVETLSERRFFADYELLEELGRGGSGIVFKARQFGVNRIVALKLLSGGPAAGRDFIYRFHTEATAAAQLEHPNIVPIYEFGEHEGAHFLAMRYLEGGTLADKLRPIRPDTLSQTSSLLRSLGEGGSKDPQSDTSLINTQLQLGVPEADSAKNCFHSFPPGQAAHVLHQIALAVEHAHRRGILHRDLKPGNILLDSGGLPYITDFGLARVLEHDSSLTLSHSVLGTIAYLSPEVAAHGASVATIASDIYALGAILYELLSGRSPFQKPSMPATLRAIAEENPAPISQSAIGSPQSAIDLETICLKCLEKDPSKRYTTAQSLADDLQHFLNNEPISARPITRPAKLLRWCQRNPALATAYSLLLLLLLGSPIAAFLINQARKSEISARSLAGVRRYTADMNVALQTWREGNLKRARTLLAAHNRRRGPSDLRGFEWRYLWNLFRDESKFTFPKSSSGIQLASGPNRTIAAVAAGRAIRLLDCARHSELGSIDVTNSISALTYSPADSNLLAVACGPTLTLWNLADRRITSAFALSGNAVSLAISPDGKLLAASTGQARTVELWRLENPTSLWRAATPTSADGLTFTPDGRFLVSGGAEQCDPIVWDLRTGSASPFSGVRHGIINTLAFSPDGQILASGSTDSSIVLWDFSQRRLLARLEPSSGGGVTCIAFSPDGRQLVAGHEGAMLRLWDATERKEEAILRGHEATIRGVAFSSDGRSVISAGADGFVKLWDSDRPPDKDTLANYETWAVTSDFSPDAALLASGTTSANPPGTFDVWDIATRRKTSLTNAPSRGVSAFSPDGKILAQAANDRILLWNTATFSLSGTLTNGFDAISLSFSPDGRTLAAAGREDFIRKGITNCLAFWDLSQKAKITKLQAAAPFATVVSFAHRAPILAVGHDSGTVRLWNYDTEQLLAEFTNQRARIWALAFSPDDQLLSAGGEQGVVEFYDVPARRAFAPMARTSSWVAGLCFAPDGKTLASAEGDGTVNLWNVATREIALILRGHAGPLSPGLSFSPDGNLLVSSGADGKVRLWPATPADKIPRSTEEQP